MLEEIRQTAIRQRDTRATRHLVLDCKRLLSSDGEMGGMAVACGLMAVCRSWQTPRQRRWMACTTTRQANSAPTPTRC